MSRRRAPERRRRSAVSPNIIPVHSRLNGKERRPQLQGTKLVPVLSQMPDELDDSYGFVDDAAPLIGNVAFPVDPYDGQHFWLHHMDTREMNLFIFCGHYGKWVCPIYYHACQTVNDFATTAGSYSPVTSGQVGRVTIQNAQSLFEMGVRFEVQFGGRLTTDQAGKLADATVARYEWNEGDAGMTFAQRSPFSISSNAEASFSMRTRDWHNVMNISPIRKNMTFLVEVKRDIGTAIGTFTHLSFSVRLVSAAVV